MDRTQRAVYHDYFAIRGGGERLALVLSQALGADLIYGYCTPDTYDVELFPKRKHDLGLGGWRTKFGLTSVALSLGFAAERKRALSYEVRIFSGVAAPFAAPKGFESGVNIFYCHTPPRFLYDQKFHFRSGKNLFRKVGLSLIGPFFQRSYEQTISRMHVVVANSENIRQRIKTYLGRDSIVVYPPVDTSGYKWSEQKGYYLSTARLTALKRVRSIIEAFLAMPDKELVVASGGDQEAELRALAGGAKNIRFTGWISDTKLRELVAGAVATIYIPVEEDFGMSPVESMAAGKPVIGVAEGGLLETIVPNVTGILLPQNPSAADVAEAVSEITPERALQMRDACEKRAQLFTREKFLANMRKVIADAQSAKGIAP